MPKLALQAALCYNRSLNNMVSGGAINTPDRIHLIGDVPMNTVPHSASDDNLKLPIAPGIYKITCLINGKIYIGSTINLRKRKNEHFSELRQNKHCNPKLQHSWNKYGPDAFTFEIQELVLIPEMLTVQEQYWFKKLKPFGRNGFNLAPTAGSPLGRKMSPEARENMSIARKGKKLSPEHREKLKQSRQGRITLPETREKLRQAKLGKKVSPETREKLSKVNLGNKNSLGAKRSPEEIEMLRQINLGKKMSPEACEKMRQAQLGKKHTPEQIEKHRQSQLGNTYCLGYKQTPEHIEKVRQSLIGHKVSPESREKMRQAAIAREAKKRALRSLSDAE